MTSRFVTTLRQQRARIGGIAMLLFVIAGLALSPFAAASADPTSTGTVAQPTDASTPDATTPGSVAPETTTEVPASTTSTEAPPTTTTTVVPVPSAPTVPTTTVDDDGVATEVEARAPHDGDNNRDGVADSEQANVASLPAAIDVDGNGALDDYVTILSPAGTSLRDVRALPIPTDNPPPEGVSLPYGLFDYDVHVANPGDAASVTYITPDGYVPSSVHFLQHGVWSDLADRTEIDARTGDATVALQDGGAGDAGVPADAVIADPSGPSTRDRSITVTVASGPGAPNFTLKLVRCTGSSQQLGSGGCSGPLAMTTGQGANNAAGETAPLGNGASWNWGGVGSTQLDQNWRYQLSVTTSLPASGWDLTSIDCAGVNQQDGNADNANARNIFLENDSGARSTCTATFGQAVASITVHKKGDRNGASVNNLAGASFQAYSDSSYSSAVAGATCVTGAGGSCVIGNLDTHTTYYVRETTAPANFQRIDTLTTSSGGSQVYGQAITTGGNGSNSDTRDFANRRINPAFPNRCGINIGLVMDLSNSISASELTDMKTSAKAFVTALQGTPSKVAGYTFGTNAPAGGQSNLALTDVSSAAGADAARQWITNRTGQQGGTNWDAGLRQVVAAAGSYDIVVFLTDGNPTYYGDPQSGGNGSSTTFDTIENGVFSSNAVKAANPTLKMVGVLIGSDASVDNIQAVTGPTANDDYFLAADFEDLQQKLEQIASQLCGGTVTVKKQVEGPSGFAPAGGWTFTVPGAVPGSGVTAAGTGVTPPFDVTPGTVTITEAQQPGYDIVPQSARNASCTKNGSPVPVNQITDTADGVSLAVGANDIVACEFRNTPTKATVKVRKQTTGGFGGPFTIQRSGNGVGTQNLNFTTSVGSNPTAFQSMSLFPGTYTLTETSLPIGWVFDTADCGTVDAGTKSTTLTVTAGQTVECTVTNKSTAGTIELAKTWSGALTGDAPTVSLQIGTSNGGTQVANQTVTGPGVGSTGAKNVTPGKYFVQESGLASGWLQTSLTCSTNGGAPVTYVPVNGVAVPTSGSVVCMVTNTRQKGTIELKKVWSGGALGEQPTTTLQIGTGASGASASNVASQGVTGLGDGTTGAKAVGVGTYFVSETGLSAGWAQGSLTCSIDGGASTPYVPASGISVANGKAVVCTVTNTRDTGSIELKKTWSGALGGDAPQVNLQIGSTNGGTEVTNTQVTGPTTGTTGAQVVPTRTYFVQESGLPSSWAQTSLTCSTNGGAPASYAPANGIAVPKNATVVCTVTNTRQKGSIELRKSWSGGVAGEQPQTTLQIGTAGSPASVTSETVTGLVTGSTGPNTVGIGTYFVSETGLTSGWSQTGLTCRNGAQSPVAYDPQVGIVIANDDDVVCTVTNTRQTGSVRVDKHWSGGVAGETPQVDLVVSGLSGSSTKVTGLADGTTGVKPVVTGVYSVSETGLTSGWSAGAITCQRNGTGPTFGPSNFVVGVDDAVVCTVTNTRQTGSVRVDKHWSGGVAGETPQVDLVVSGLSGSSTKVTGLADGTTGVKPVVTGVYSVSETGLTSGWSAGAITCQRNGTGPTFGPSNFVVGVDDAVVCTVTNTRDGASITVDKKWVGGAAGEQPVADLNVVGLSSSSTTVTGLSDGTTGAKPVVTGTYSVTETGMTAGWTQSDVSCQRNGSGPTFGPSDFVVTADDSIVCTFTNTRQTGTVRVDKHWVGAAGGEAPTVDLHIAGLSPSTKTVTGPGDGTTGAKTVVTGTYSASESNLTAGWTQTDASCVRNGTGDAFAPSNFVVHANDTVVCTITNTRDTGSLRLDKVWVGGAEGDTPSATLEISGPSSSSKPVTGIAPGSTGTKTVATGPYTVGESGLSSAWYQQSIRCQNGDQTPFTPSPQGFVVAKGDSVVCTITNAKKGSITIVKDSKPNAAKDFGFTTTNLGGAFTLRDDGTAANTKKFANLVAGDYAVTEDANPAGWSLTAVSCVGTGASGDLETRTATVQLSPGDDVTCTFTNTGPDVGIVKTDAPDPVAAGANVTYTLAVHNYGPPAAAPVTVSDPLPANTTFVSLTADPSWSCTTPAVGANGTVSCTLAALAASADAPTITVIAKVGAGVAPGTDVITNTATIATPNDSNPANDTSTATTSVVRSVDLKVVKSDGGATPTAGGSGFQYTLSIDNLGPSDASTAATVTDVIPAGISFESFGSLPGGVSCTPPASGSQTFTCAIPANQLDVSDAAVVIPVNVTVPSTTGPGSHTNKVIVSSSDDVAPCTVTSDNITCDPSDTNNYSQVTTPVKTSVDLAIKKAAPATGVAGNDVTYTLDVSNLGPSDATSVVVDDALPAGLSYVSASGAGWSCSESPAGNVHCTRPALAVGSAPAITVVAHVASSVTGTVKNCATVKDTFEPDSNDTSCGETTIETKWDLAIKKAARATGVAGNDVTYTLDVSNLGPSDATSVVVDDALPAGLSYVSASGAGWSCSESPAGNVHCTRPALAVGSAPAITVVAHVASSVTGTVKNCATVTDTFPNDENDTSCVDTTITPEVDVSIVKTDTPDPVVAGENLTYKLAVANGGPSNATDVAVSDPLPADTTFVSITAGAGWSCTTPAVGATGSVSCSLASLPVGPAPSITVVVKVGAGVAPGTDVIVNTATVTAPHDTNPDNDTSTAKTSVVRVLDLAVTKSDGGAEPVAGSGDPFTYTITVDNLGPSDAGTAGTVSDTLPAGVDFVSFGTLPTGVDCTPPVAGAFTCTVDASLLQVSDPQVVITLQVTVPASTPAGTLTNTVVVTTPEEPCPGSPNCGNNTDRTDTPLTTSVDLTVRKSDGGAQPVGGVPGADTFTYTLTVDNDGPSDVSADATVTDVMPAGIDFVSYGTLPAGVSCTPPSGRTLECTIAKELLAVSSPAVVITVHVTVPATTPGGDVTNKVIVTNPDDEAPCTVTPTDITCDPSDTNNYSEVTTPVVQVTPEVVAPIALPARVKGASLAFTGSDGGRLALLGAVLVAVGAVLVLGFRRRRRTHTG